jgi:formylmethanofuran dehydrogenase subunit E
MYRTNDPFADLDRWEWEKERRLNKLPKCSECGEHIQSEYAYQFNGEYICPDCLAAHKVDIEEEW